MFQSLEYKHPKFYQVFRLFIVFFASLLYAWNLRCFAKTAGLFPGGFSGLSLLLQQIGLDFIHVSIPFSVFNIGLNLVPTYIAYKFIGKKFTLYSIIVIVLTSIFIDMLPIKGTPLGDKDISGLTTEYCMKVLCLARLMVPQSDIRCAAGREIYFKGEEKKLLSVVDSIFASGYLTAGGQGIQDTIKTIEDAGFTYEIESA